MKKLICLFVAVMMMVVVMTSATAESALNDFSSRLLQKAAGQSAADAEPAAEPAAAPVEDNSFGTKVTIDDAFFAKVRSSAYLREDKYATEANVMIELKNVSGKTLYPDDATITAYNEAGEVLAEETYAYVGPEMVADGDSLFVWDWFYDSIENIADVSYFAVTVEAETDSYNTYEKIDAQAIVSDGIAYALVENTTENDIYGIDVTVSIENADGVLLDVVEVTTGNTVGIFPGSTMILRDNAEDYANDGYLSEGIATAHALYELD